MFKKLFTLLFVLIWCTSLIAQDLATDSGKLPGQNSPYDGTAALLWDNYLTPSTTAIVSGEWLGLPAGANSTQCADDFVIPAGETWDITEVLAPGFYSAGSALADNWLIQFWTDAPGSPGTLIESRYVTLTSTDTVMGTFPTVTLSEGTYWVSVMGSNNTASTLAEFRWNWYSSEDPGVGLEPHLNDLAGFFGGTAGWVTFTSLGIGQYANLMFQIYGELGGGGTGFTDNFDAYTAGVQLVVQNNLDWDTWSGGSGTTEDPFVSNAYSYSGANSVVVVGTSGAANDFIRRHGDLTTGKWYMSFAFYIPATKSGYFNTMNQFDVTTEWGMDSYFDVGGTGRLDTTGAGGGGTTNVDFTYAVGEWNQVIVVVDLDATPPLAEYWLATNPSNLTQIATWDWTQGGTKANQLAVNDFFGADVTDEMYIDDYYFGDALPPIIPVELTSFIANVNQSGQVELNWSTATEINNQMFEIERRTEAGQFATIGYVEGHGTTTEPQNYSYTDVTVSTGIYFYRLKQLDFLGSYEYFDEIEVDVTGPLSFDLGQNYPNPFNPSTNIKYSVPETGDIRLAVYNLIGEEVAVLVDGFSEAGFFEVTFDASSLPSGAYFYKLQSGNNVVAKKMLLMK